MTKKTHLALVGGFLGAGKTTLLWETARRLTRAGKRVGLITNDQAPDLVDTALLSAGGFRVGEVAGSCFCCNFQGFLDAAETLKGELQPDVIIAEPVGSCTDLSATILQPLKDKFAGEFELAPLSVLVDPFRAKEVLTGAEIHLHRSAAYILRKQMEEADILALNKIDLLGPDERRDLQALVHRQLPGIEIHELSALTGEGVDGWIARLFDGAPAGRRIADVDYDTYAEGEAVLGWLNANIRLTSAGGLDWSAFGRRLLESLRDRVRRQNAEVGHIKLLLTTNRGACMGNLTRLGGDISYRGNIPCAAQEAALVLNARVEMTPEELEAVVREAVGEAAGEAVTIEYQRIKSLSPARPAPTYRYSAAVMPSR